MLSSLGHQVHCLKPFGSITNDYYSSNLFCPKQHSNHWSYQQFRWPHLSVQNCCQQHDWSHSLPNFTYITWTRNSAPPAGGYQTRTQRLYCQLHILCDLYKQTPSACDFHSTQNTTGHLWDHQNQYSKDLNLNTDLKAEATLKTHRFQKTKNRMDDAVPPPTPCIPCTMTSSYDVCITDKMSMHQ